MATDRPMLEGVLETVLYYTDQERAARFYEEILGMRRIAWEPRRSLFYRAGNSVFLLFDADETAEGGRLPGHGARGPIHTCFLASPGEYDRWKRYLTERGVPVIRETEWESARSFYFHDPDGNVLEIAEADIWPR
jgi:catechol 2,3-dioxygenase-like lactoylglutathione lyase family enzyme